MKHTHKLVVSAVANGDDFDYQITNCDYTSSQFCAHGHGILCKTEADCTTGLGGVTVGPPPPVPEPTPMDQDCVVSAWTAWTDCSETCGGGTQTRSRTIDIPPVGDGAPCPTTLQQTQACNTEGCRTFTLLSLYKTLFHLSPSCRLCCRRVGSIL